MLIAVERAGGKPSTGHHPRWLPHIGQIECFAIASDHHATKPSKCRGKKAGAFCGQSLGVPPRFIQYISIADKIRNAKRG